MPSKSFHVNADSMIAGADYIADVFNNKRGIIEYDLFNTTKQIISSEFAEAAAQANEEDGFPEEYQAHLLSVVNQIRPAVIVDGAGVFVDLNLDELGDYEDLSRAFHQGALLADGTHLWGPYEGQELKQEDTEARHQFWEAFRYGQSSVSASGKSNIPTHKLQKYSWEEVKQQYINIWGKKAPEWLLIQFGQEEWEPYVPQIDIMNNIKVAVREFFELYLEQLLYETVNIANQFEATGLDVGYDKGSGALRVKKGTYEVNGKVYRPGRFVPRSGF